MTFPLPSRGISAAIVTGSLWSCVFAQSSHPTPPSRRPLSPNDQYVLGPDSHPQAKSPAGEIREFFLADTKAYPGFQRKGCVYIPAQWDRRTPLPVMIFLDGMSFARRDGVWRAPVVLDNLIAKKQVPVLAAIFIDPGDIPLTPGEPPRKRPDGRPMHALNRDAEYMTAGPAFANFLLEEIFPAAREHIIITDDPEGRGICGVSASAKAAFIAAWERPDQFRKVYAMVGSFADEPGEPTYPELIRREARKPLRLFVQDGKLDVTARGSLTELNQAIVAALAEKGYDHQFVLGEGTHNIKHGASLLPYALRWLWRDYAVPPLKIAPSGKKNPILAKPIQLNRE